MSTRTATHYGADKAGPLVIAALELRCVAPERYAAVEGDDQEFTKVLQPQQALDNAISRVMWVLARWKRDTGGELWRSDIDDLRIALRRLSELAETMSALALPDPVDGLRGQPERAGLPGQLWVRATGSATPPPA